MLNGRIDACFDSHVHWAATGEFRERISLSALRSAKDVLALPPESSGPSGWTFGFGWDETGWPDADRLHRKLLDSWCADRPVLFTRVDGHVGWVNSAALQAVGWTDDQGRLKIEVPTGGRIDLGADGSVRGLLVDKAYDRFLKQIPAVTPSDVRRHLLKATKIFHSQGFTHIRDVGGSREHWQQALLLDRAQLLGLAVEMFFHLEELEDLESLCDFVVKARSETGHNLAAKGIKFFIDGALGSEGAWISQNYASGSGNGLRLITESEIETICRAAWERKLEVAVHVIGDAAVHQMIEVAIRLQDAGVRGRLHLEHAELIRPETIALMTGLDVICHLQPCHWLSDRRWLKDKVGDQLYRCSFPWRRLQEAKIDFDFGSDSPIEPPSVSRTIQALDESAQDGIPKLLGQPNRYLSHSDRSWAPNSYTIFENGVPVQLVFRGDHL